VRAARHRSAWVGLGFAGSVALCAASTQILENKPTRWWFTLDLGSSGVAHVVLWAGVAALCVAWLGLGLVERADRRTLLFAGGLWAAPLLIGPALFSGDVYSYLADGDLLRHGIDPYHHGPAALAGVHQAHVLATVSPLWHHTTVPYGPLFVGLAAVASAIAGSHLVLGVVLLRALELPGLLLLAVYVPRLARTLGADPDRATWLAVVSPVVLLELVGGAHNDALMAGLLVAGVAYAVERRPLVAIALCTCAGLVKLPAFAAVAFVLVCWLRETPGVARARARVGAGATLVVAGIITAAGLVTTVGFSWLSGSLLDSTTKLHLALTPSTAIGYTLHAVSGAAGSAHPLESSVGTAAVVLGALIGVRLLWRVDYDRLAASLAAMLLVALLAGPAVWPWYLAWGFVLFAVAPRGQVHPVLPAAILAACVVIGPGGQLSLPIGDAPIVLAVYAAALGLVAFDARRPPRSTATAPRWRGPRVEVAR
jgi:alpha-1,6-mannosyltransferase